MRKKLVLYCKIQNKWNCKREEYYVKHRQAYGCYNFVHHFSNTSNLTQVLTDETHLKLHRGSVSPYEKC